MPGVGAAASEPVPVGDYTLGVERDLGGLVGDVQVSQSALLIGDVGDRPGIAVFGAVAFESVKIVEGTGDCYSIKVYLLRVIGVYGLELPQLGSALPSSG